MRVRGERVEALEETCESRYYVVWSWTPSTTFDWNNVSHMQEAWIINIVVTTKPLCLRTGQSQHHTHIHTCEYSRTHRWWVTHNKNSGGQVATSLQSPSALAHRSEQELETDLCVLREKGILTGPEWLRRGRGCGRGQGYGGECRERKWATHQHVFLANHEEHPHSR